MNTVIVENCKTLFIGRRGENEVTEVVFDFSEWQAEFGNGVIDLFVKRNGDSAAYPVVLSVDGTVATWLVTATDTNVADYGKAEYVYTVNGKIAKSAVFTFYVAEDIGQASGEAPDPYEDWIETLTGLGTETQLNAQAAEQSANDAAESAASAATSADQSEDSAEDAEAWAVGERNGEPVTEGDPTYNNNAKFWAGKAMTDAPVTSVNGKSGDIVLNLDDIPNGEQYARTTPAQVQQIGDNAADIADIEELIPTEASANNPLADKNYVNSRDQSNADAIAEINSKIPPQASASNKLADKILVNTKLMAYRTSADQDAIDSAQDGKINALTNLLNNKQTKITANGILKGNGNGGVSAAVAGMDYLPTSALYAYRSANAQDAIDNAQNTNIDKNTAAINTMQPAATAADIGKALIIKAVENGKPSAYEYGEAGGGGSALTAGDGINITEDVISNTQGIEYIVGTQTAATSKWTGTSTDEALKVGKIIAYYLPYAGASTAATLALTMADGTTTREISLQLKPNATVTTQFPAGSIIILVYDGTYWRVNASYDTDTNTYPTGYCVTNGSVAAKTATCSFGYRGDTNYFPCLFRFANTATDATLAITTYAAEAAPIYVNGARTSATNTFGAGVILLLYYNGAYYCYNDGRFPILVDGTVTSVQEYAAGLLADYRTAADQDAIDAGKQAKITASGILKGNGAGGVSSAVAGTDYATVQQVNAKYTKPADGIPSTDMTAAVQASLQKADSALQTVPDTYRTAADQDAIDASQNININGNASDIDDIKSAFNDYDSKTNIKENYIDLTKVEGVYINSATGSPLFSGAVNKISNVVSFNNVTFAGDNWCMFLTGTTLARSNWQGTYNSVYDACYVDAVPGFVIGHIYRAHCFIVEGTYTLTDTTLKNFSYVRIADRSEQRSRNLYNGSVWKCNFIPQIIGALVRKGNYNCKIAYYLEDITDSYNEAVPEAKNLLQIFDKITAVGDSLTAGYTESTTPAIGSEAAKARGTNWPAYIGADISRTITNLAVGSSSWKDWRYNTGSVDISSANIDTNCYIVGLGINDSIDGNTIGTSSDIADNKTNNADSVYGNADFVIRTLHEYNPNAHIFVLTIPVATVTNYTGINEALRYVSSQYDYTHCIDLAKLYLNDYSYGIFENLRYGVHYEPLGYRIIANYLSTAINSFILTNYPLFVKVPYEL